MTTPNKGGIAFSILMIALGISWLLNVFGALPGVNWIWTGSIGVLGALILAFGGRNQLTFIVGPLLIVGSILSVLRQTGKLSVEVEIPILVICFGVLMLIAMVFKLPYPQYLKDDQETN